MATQKVVISGAGDDDLLGGHVLAEDLEGVGQRGEGHDRGAVLVVVEHRDVEAGPQPLLDGEAGRGGDVLEVDAPERGGDALHGLDDGVGLGLGSRECRGVDAHRLSLIHI